MATTFGGWPTFSEEMRIAPRQQNIPAFLVRLGMSCGYMTVSESGRRPEARPMHVAKAEDGAADVLFFTSKGARLVDKIKADATVLLAFQNENSAYLSLRGTVRLVEDRKRIKELWKEPYRVWFPGGAEDPDIALVAVKPINAEYWDNRGLNKWNARSNRRKRTSRVKSPM